MWIMLLIGITGMPGAGKSAIYEVAKKYGYSKKRINEFLDMLKRKIVE